MFNREDSIALIYGTGPKNLSIALAIALIIALAYIIQLQTSAWCNRLVDRCFGVPETVVEQVSAA